MHLLPINCPGDIDLLTSLQVLCKQLENFKDGISLIIFQRLENHWV